MSSDPLYLLDTTIMMALIRGGSIAHEIDGRFELRQIHQRPLISVVSHGEIGVLGRWNSWGPQRLKALRGLLNTFVTVDINHPNIIEAYIDLDIISRDHPDGARTMGKNDLWIAATARATKSSLLAMDRDFTHLLPEHVSGHVLDRETGIPIE